jgi:hypothetical protein
VTSGGGLAGIDVADDHEGNVNLSQQEEGKKSRVSTRSRT